ncbi:hypothetical protein BDV06DRAFT_40739 [Aspergillus oleicola]
MVGVRCGGSVLQSWGPDHEAGILDNLHGNIAWWPLLVLFIQMCFAWAVPRYLNHRFCISRSKFVPALMWLC